MIEQQIMSWGAHRVKDLSFWSMSVACTDAVTSFATSEATFRLMSCSRILVITGSRSRSSSTFFFTTESSKCTVGMREQASRLRNERLVFTEKLRDSLLRMKFANVVACSTTQR